MSKMILSKLGTIIALVILLTENCSCAFSPSSLGSRLIAPAQSRSDVHVSPPITSSCLPTTRQLTNDEHFILYAKIDSNEDREGSLAAATKALGKVPYGEISRKYRRTVFKHDDWVNHRQSNSKVFDNLQSMFFSGVVRQLRPQVGSVTAVAAAVMGWNMGVVDLAASYNIWLPTLTLPVVPFTLSSPALGLLLVFRTNAAYTRWMAARDSWARMSAHSKNLVRMGSIFSSDQSAVKEMSNACWLYARTVMNKLSSPGEDEEEYIEEVLERYQDSSIGTRVIKSKNRVIAAWRQLSIQLHSLPASDPKALIETDKSIIVLGECTAICEKIYSSPVPLVYTRHTARFLSLWALTLPCALYSAFSALDQTWATLPATSILAFFLFGVDELAMQLEEPFSILPMKYFVDDISESAEILTETFEE
ncbi:bestrophin family protein [Skeletonema marinoi]|uniref:Bestrophin family protein n=1 Tax=Skeletonema marinoi TaxID=267567 RepID=A0AAD9DJD8_9STRA|nr:bestrophin family protein [Skeletonema marinoi]